MKGKTVRVLSILLCLLLLLSGCGASDTSSPSKETDISQSQKEGSKESSATGSQSSTGSLPDYINASGLPIVAEGVDKNLKLGIVMSDLSGDPEDMWMYKFIEDQMNIQLEIEKISDLNREEYISLTFASNTLPDAILGANLEPNDIVMFGSLEGQLLDLAPYINEENMPNLTSIYTEHPEYKQTVTDTEGHVYSLGYINDPADRGQIPRSFTNYDWLDELNMEVPTNLEDYITMLKAFKEMGDDMVPMGGSYEHNNPCLILLNAYGYNTTDAKGLTVGLRGDDVVLPVADREAYGAYLETMNQLYSKGLIHPDFYTMDSNTVSAIISEDRVGVVAQAPSVFTENYTAYWGAIPLTSEYNDTAFWPVSTGSISAGRFVASSQCQEPELLMAFTDWFFDAKNYAMACHGAPDSQPDLLYGTDGWKLDEEGIRLNHEDLDYEVKHIRLQNVRVLGLGTKDTNQILQEIEGWSEIKDAYPDPATYTGEEPFRHTLKDKGEAHFRLALQETQAKYTVPGYPNVVYFSPEVSTQALNLRTIIKEYAEQETAKFVTGARDLAELEAYFNEIERLGATEYVQYYQEYYDAMNG